MQKITQFQPTDKPSSRYLVLAVDVSSLTLDVYSRYRQGGTEFELCESFANDLPTIDQKLEYYTEQAHQLGYEGLSVVVEPSGCYEHKLTQAALKLGIEVWTVNPERMYKAGVIHHGDDGKSDPLDGKVLYMMAAIGKVSRLVLLAAPWQELRQLGQWLEDCTLAAADARIHIGTLRRALFVDWKQSGDVSWGATGRALQSVYAFDPWRITSDSFEDYVGRMRAHHKGLPERGLVTIWEQAQSSCKAPLSSAGRQALKQQLMHVWNSWELHHRRKINLGQHMVELVETIEHQEYRIPPLVSGFTALARAKILAETGPWEHFPHWRALTAYAGLKVRSRSSGRYRGQDKITKKGRILLRKYVGQVAWVLARKDRILGPYYHRKLAEGMPPGKARVASMRKLVKMLYGAAKSGQEFNAERVYRCTG